MKAWISDATELQITIDNEYEYGDYIVMTPAVREFMQIDSGDHKSFIAAPKGVGKTLLLKTKSQIYRSQFSGYSFIPSDELVEQLTTQDIRISPRDQKAYADYDLWLVTWKLALHLAILRRFGVELSREIESILGIATALPDILRVLVGKVSTVHKLSRNYMAQELSPKLRELHKYSEINQVAMFIDNLDESFRQSLVSEVSTSSDDAETLTETIWMNAQMALAETVRKIRAENRHIRIFVSIRSEAFDFFESSIGLQLRGHTTFLEYSQSELREIFIRNIRQTADYDLKEPNSKNPIRKFFGFEKIPHRHVIGNNNNAIQEGVFDYVLRHTFRRPREIIYIGEKIRNITPASRNLTAVVDVVNQVAHEIFNQYQAEIVPRFKRGIYEELFSRVDSNVISYSDAKRIESHIESEHGFKNAFSYFWRLGLVGIVERNASSDLLVQKFAPVGKYSGLGNAQISEAVDFYLIHPALDADFTHNLGNLFNTRDNIIGQGREFRVSVNNSIPPLHLHLGLDRDSLALMIPEHDEFKCLAVAYNPNSEYLLGLGTNTRVLFETNQNKVIVFDVIHDNMPIEQARNLIQDWRNGRKKILVSTQNDMAFRLLIRHAETISVLESSHENLLADVKRILNTFGQVEPSKNVYIGRKFWPAKIKSIQNNHCAGYWLHPLIADRYFYEYQTIDKEDKDFLLKIETESYGQIICQYRDGLSLKRSKIVQRPMSDNEFMFFNNRQRLIVEGCYRLYKVVVQSSPELVKNKNLRKSIFRLFFSVQLLRLLSRSRTTRVTLEGIFGSKTENDINNILYELCMDTYQRAEKVFKYKNHSKRDTLSYIAYCKQQGIFPRAKEFYKFIRESELFLENDVVLELRRLLNIDYRQDRASIFISYSSEDSVFANMLYQSLEKRGISSVLYEEDNKNKRIEKFMNEAISQNDKLLFIASKSSVTSPLCQYELQKAREKYERTWERIFVPIRLDDYILTVSEEDIQPPEKRADYWKNIQTIRQVNIPDFSDFLNVQSSWQYEKLLDEVLEQAMVLQK